MQEYWTVLILVYFILMFPTANSKTHMKNFLEMHIMIMCTMPRHFK